VLGAVGGFIFAREDDPTVPMDRHQFGRLLDGADDGSINRGDRI